MADTQILRPGGPAPFDYELPANAEILLKVARAKFDGSGAGSAFLPMLTIESDAGEVVAEITAPEVAAGGTAPVSWFFGAVDETSAAPPPAGSGVQWAYIDSNEVARACPPGTTTRIPAVAGTFYTNAPSTFDTHPSVFGVQGMRILADGHYAFWMTGGLQTAPAATDAYQILIEGGGTVADFGTEPQAIFTPIAGFPPNAFLVHGLMSVGGFITPPTDAMVFRFDNFSGATTMHVVYTGLWVMQLDTVNHDL